MDDLKRVKGFRSAEPAPDDSARDAARSALARATAAEGGGGARVTRRRPRFRVLALGATAVAAAVIGVSLLALGNSPVGPRSAAAATLNRLAVRIAAQPLTPQTGQYLYVDSKNDYSAFDGDCQTFRIDHRQIWIGADGSGLIRDTEGPEQYTSAADRSACLRQKGPHALRSAHTSDDWFAPQCLSLKPSNRFEWNDLSTDPQTLLQQMRQLDGGPSTPGEDFQHIGDFLRETDAPPAVRATLYQAAALIPGIELLGTVRDHDGRTGLGIAFPSEGPFVTPGSSVKSELIFDPQTGELLAEQVTGALDAAWAAYQPEQVVDQLPDNPPAPLTPPCDARGGGTVHDVPGGTLSNGAPSANGATGAKGATGAN
ncbi:MAG TPA: CU044_5270 family protein [Gaiellaceae bacterium]|jgi:RNA polymerase sigma-70 factor (ECF subfamily)